MTRIAALPHRTLIRMTGPDWAPFLKGLCTAHIDSLIRDPEQNAVIKPAYGAFLRPQGKMYADALLHRVADEEVHLDVAVSARDELLTRLNMYKLRAKVTLEALDLPVFVAFDGPFPPHFAPDPRGDIVGAPFAFAYGDHTANATHDDWTNFRFSNGLSDPGADFGPDELYAIDANLDLLGAIDFHKGCYVGQELTSRMKRRGQIKNRILPISHSRILTAGSEVMDADLRAGRVLASTPSISLALMRLDRIEPEYHCDGGVVDLLVPNWLRQLGI